MKMKNFVTGALYVIKCTLGIDVSMKLIRML